MKIVDKDKLIIIYSLVLAVIIFGEVLKSVLKSEENAAMLCAHFLAIIKRILSVFKCILLLVACPILFTFNVVPLGTFVESVFDVHTLTIFQSVLRLIFSSVSTFIALQTIAISALLALGVFSVFTLFALVYIAFNLCARGKSTNNSYTEFKKAFYRLTMSVQKCYLSFSRLIS